MKAKASIFIHRPIQEVFDYLTDVSNLPAWMTGVDGARLIDPHVGPGARYILSYTGGWRSNDLEVVVTEYRPPAEFASTVTRGPFAFEGTTLLAEGEGGTEVTNIIEAGPDSLASRIASLVLGWLLRGSVRRRLLRELEALQHSIEGDASLKT